MPVYISVENNRFLQETTLHGFGHLRHSRSKIGSAFWLIATFVSLGYAGFEISREIGRVTSNVQFSTTFRPALRSEIELPEFKFCYSNKWNLLDWRLVEKYALMFNWTVDDLHILFSTSYNFGSLRLRLSSQGLVHLSSVSNRTNDTADARKAATDQVRRMFKRSIFYLRSNGSHDFWELAQGRGKIFDPYTNIDQCFPIKLERIYLPCSDKHCNTYIRFMVKDPILTGTSKALQQRFIKFMQQLQDANDIENDDYYILYSSEFVPRKLKIEKGSEVDVDFDPLRSNYATRSSVDCLQRVCKHKVDDGEYCKQYTWTFSSNVAGIDCNQWQYFWHTEENKLNTHGAKIDVSIIGLKFPNSAKWQIREYKPIFVWYQTLSNIGGILGIWTGASVLSFLHLIGALCCRCCKFQRKTEQDQNYMPTI